MCASLHCLGGSVFSSCSPAIISGKQSKPAENTLIEIRHITYFEYVGLEKKWFTRILASEPLTILSWNLKILLIHIFGKYESYQKTTSVWEAWESPRNIKQKCHLIYIFLWILKISLFQLLFVGLKMLDSQCCTCKHILSKCCLAVSIGGGWWARLTPFSFSIHNCQYLIRTWGVVQSQ